MEYSVHSSIDLEKDYKQQESWEKIFSILTGFRASCVVINATRLGYFDGPNIAETLDEIAKRLNITGPAARVIVNSLAQLNLVRKSDGKYKIEAGIHELFQEDGPRNIKHNVLAFSKEISVWNDMDKIITGEKPRVESYSRELLDSQIDKFAGLCLLNRLDCESNLPTVLKHIKNNDRVLDIGGGEGYYALRLREHISSIRVDILDFENAFAICDRINAHYIEDGSVNKRIGDALELQDDQTYDVVMMNELLELFSLEEKLEITRRAVRAVKPGGNLIITKFPIDKTHTGPHRFPLFSVRMYLKFNEGYLESDQEAIEMAEACGMTLVESVDANRTVLIFKKQGRVRS